MTSSRVVSFDVRSDLNDVTLSLNLVGIKKEVPDKSLVLFCPGMRARSGWGYSNSLKGAFQYVNPDPNKNEFRYRINGLNEFLTGGIVIMLTTFGRLTIPINEVLSYAEIEIHGFEPGTCEEWTETCGVDCDLRDHSKDLSLITQQMVETVRRADNTGSTISALKASVKNIPGATRLYRALKN